MAFIHAGGVVLTLALRGGELVLLIAAACFLVGPSSPRRKEWIHYDILSLLFQSTTRPQ
jgi:hypothetical protein